MPTVLTSMISVIAARSTGCDQIVLSPVSMPPLAAVPLSSAVPLCSASAGA
jgi:hypothetical protein